VLNAAPCGPDVQPAQAQQQQPQQQPHAQVGPAKPASTRRFDAGREAVSRIFEYVVPSAALVALPRRVLEGGMPAMAEHLRSFRLSPKSEQHLNALLALFQTGGTKGIPWNRASWDFALFTEHPADPLPPNGKPKPSTRRSVKQFRCGERLMLGGVEHVALRVEGNSFVPCQVRKMVGLLLLLAQATSPRPAEEVVLGALQCEGGVHVPLAPAHPLLLDRIVYGVGEKAASPPRDGWSDSYSVQQMEAFKRSVLYPHIASPAALHAFATWLLEAVPSWH